MIGGRAAEPTGKRLRVRVTMRGYNGLPKNSLIAKETLEIGCARVATRTHEREALVDENLGRERVQIETVPIGRRIDAMPEVRQEGDTTINSGRGGASAHRTTADAARGGSHQADAHDRAPSVVMNSLATLWAMGVEPVHHAWPT